MCSVGTQEINGLPNCNHRYIKISFLYRVDRKKLEIPQLRQTADIVTFFQQLLSHLVKTVIFATHDEISNTN
jgi:hypothetical protein